jgi:hypothetical protein
MRKAKALLPRAEFLAKRCNAVEYGLTVGGWGGIVTAIEIICGFIAETVSPHNSTYIGQSDGTQAILDGLPMSFKLWRRAVAACPAKML